MQVHSKQNSRNHNHPKEVIHLKGVITPDDWDDKGILSISISTDNEHEFPIVMDAIGNRLMSLLYEPIQIQGVLFSDAQGDQYLKVLEYSLCHEELGN